MILGKRLTRKKNGQSYYVYFVNIPKKLISELRWKEGNELQAIKMKQGLKIINKVK